MADQPAPKGPPKLQIQLDDQIAAGYYSNFMLVNHTENEFVVDFACILPGPPRAKVGSRVVMSPRHLKRVIDTLQKNVEKFEERFGFIQPLESDPGNVVH
jgi:hypothetical protein